MRPPPTSRPSCAKNERVLYVTFERLVRRRPDTVWSFLTDLSAVSTWVEGLVDLRVVGDAEPGVGTRLELARRVTATQKIDHVTSEITAWREPSLLALETRLPKVVLLDRVTLTTVAEGTRLGVFAELNYGGAAAGLFGRAPGLSEASPRELQIRGIYERSIDAPVTRIEKQSAIPYR